MGVKKTLKMGGGPSPCLVDTKLINIDDEPQEIDTDKDHSYSSEPPLVRQANAIDHITLPQVTFEVQSIVNINSCTTVFDDIAYYRLFST